MCFVRQSFNTNESFHTRSVPMILKMYTYTDDYDEQEILTGAPRQQHETNMYSRPES